MHRPLIRAALAAAAVGSLSWAAAAQAGIVTFVGDTTGGPTFNRPLEDLSALSAVGTAVAYDVYEFSVDTSGSYTFLTTAEFDPFLVLYGPTFDPGSPLSNALIADDDLLGFTTSGFAFSLIAGANYLVINTGFANTHFGNFSTTIGGPGAILPIPEPGTFALLALGLALFGAVRLRGPSEAG